MTHSDDDGLVLPPKLAPQQIVIMPIFRNDEEKAGVMEYCNSLLKELQAQTFDGEKVRVQIDARNAQKKEGGGGKILGLCEEGCADPR